MKMKNSLLVFIVSICCFNCCLAQENSMLVSNIEKKYNINDTIVIDINNKDTVDHRFFIKIAQWSNNYWVPRVPEGQQSYFRQGKIASKKNTRIIIPIRDLLIDIKYDSSDIVNFRIKTIYSTPLKEVWEEGAFKIANKSTFNVTFE